jgi:hypothetical protein
VTVTFDVIQPSGMGQRTQYSGGSHDTAENVQA